MTAFSNPVYPVVSYPILAAVFGSVTGGTPITNLPDSVLAPFTTAVWGQSEHQHILNEFDDRLDPESLVDQDRVTFWWHDRTNNDAAGVQSVTLNDATVATSTVTAAMVAMGNTFMRQIPDRDIKIVMHTQSGTSPSEIMDNSAIPETPDGEEDNAPRRWQDDWALNAAATADGHLIDHPWHSWFAAPGSYADDYGQNMFTFIKGRDHETGAELVYSDTDPLDVNGIQVSRTLRDVYTHEPAWVVPSSSHVFIPTDDLNNATTLSAGGIDFSLLNKQRSTESWRTVIRNEALSAHFSNEVPHLNGYANGEDQGGEWRDQAHPTGIIDAGINRMARQIAHTIMRGADVTSWDVPSITDAEWQDDGSYMEMWSSAGPVTSARAAKAGEFLASLGVAQVEAMNDAVKDGRVHTGHRVANFESAADWSARTGISLPNIEADVHIEGVDFTGLNIRIEGDNTVTFTDCLFNHSDGPNLLDVFKNATAIAEYCTFSCDGDGTGPGTLARRRYEADGTGHFATILCRAEGYPSDSIKPTDSDIALFNYCDTPLNSTVNPIVYVSGTYDVGVKVTADNIRNPFVWVNTVTGNTDAPDFSASTGTTINGWEATNIHADNMTLVNGANAIIFGNVLNMDPNRRQFPRDNPNTSNFVIGPNANLWSEGVNAPNAIIAGNLCLRDPDEIGGQPMAGFNGASYLLNRIESFSHEGVRYVRDMTADQSATFEGNIDPTTGQPIVLPTGGVDGVVDRTLLEPVLVHGRTATSRAQRNSAAVVLDHWTDVMGVEIDGQPAHRAEIQSNGRVRVYPNSGAFTNTSLISFAGGGSSGFVDHNADAFAGLWDDFPIVDVGLGDLAGVPLSVLPDPAILESTIVGAASFSTTIDGPLFYDTARIPANTFELTALFRGSVSTEQGGTARLLNISGSQMSLEALSNGNLRLSLRDGANVKVVDLVTADQGYTKGVVFEVIISVDMANGYARMWLDGTQVLDATFAATVALSASRNVSLLASTNSGTNQTVGTVERLAVWFEAAPDGTLPLGIPHKDISGGPSTVNADTWKLGADAT